MKPHRLLLAFLVMGIAANAWAYGSSSSTKSCTKPKFSDFFPADKSEVAPESEFSFSASSVPYPDSIDVRVKKQPVEVTISEKNGTYRVTGKLPDSLRNTYARISISAEGPSQCKGSGGWLVKITE